MPLLLCCKEENAIQKTQLLTNNEIIDTSFQVKVPICSNNKYDFTVYEKLLKNQKTTSIDKLGSKFYYSISKENFNDLFNSKNIECVTASKSEKYLYYSLKYNEKQNSKDIFLKIKELKRDNQTLNKYHDFFKRGLVFVLDTKANNITLITFNMFADNSLPKKVKNFFLSNEKSFEKVFMTTGIGNVENLIE